MESTWWILIMSVAVYGQSIYGFQGLPCVVSSDDQGTFAHCSNKNIAHFPSAFPANTTWIDLSHNKIFVLNISQELPDLVYLDISYNRLSRLGKNAFNDIPNLEELHLDHNNLELSSYSYPDDVFKSLHQLRILSLQNNDVSDTGSYPEKALGQLKTLKELTVDTFQRTIFGHGFEQMTNLTHLILGFEGCKLISIKNDTFKAFSDTNIELLNLNLCRIIQLEINAFWYLKSLQYLYMSHCNLSPREALKSMYGLRGRNVSLIQMDDLRLHNLFKERHVEDYIFSDDLFDFIKDVCVRHFSSKHNNFLWFEADIFANSRMASCIEHLDVSDNDIYGDGTLFFKLSILPNLRFVDISRHSTSSRYELGQRTETSVSPRLRGKHLSFSLPPYLQYLNINGFSVSTVSTLGDIVIYNATSLRDFRIAFNRIDRFHRFLGLEKISSLDLSGNCCGSLSSTFFYDFPSLTRLNMSGSALNLPEDYISVTGPRLLKPLNKLEIIALRNNDLTFMNPNIFEYNPLKEIDLSYNRFENIPFKLDTTRSLQYLDLSFNSLPYLEQAERELLDAIGFENELVVDMTGNLLFCGCENLDFVYWLYNNHVHIKNVDIYSCIREDGTISNMHETYQSFEFLWRHCTGRFWFLASIICFIVIILVMSFIYVICRRKTFIRNILFRLFGIYTHITHPSRKDFAYAAFLGYSDLDYKYICHTVPDKLEKKHKIRVFITDRDMLPGTSTSEEIVHAVDSSWRIVLVMTQAFLQDNWCRFTAEQAVYVSTFRPPGSVLLVLFDDVRLGDIPPALLNVVEEKHIFRVSRYWEDHDVLWKDIGEVIKME